MERIMNENLAEMVRNEPAIESENIFNPDDIVEETLEAEDATDVNDEQEQEEQEEDINEYIPTVLLSEWFEDNHTNFENINRVRIELNRVRPNRSIVTTIVDTEATDDLDRKVCMFEDADRFKVLDMESSNFHMYGVNKFRIIYRYNDIAIKCYGTKTILFAVFCNIIDDKLIPYYSTKLKPTDETLEIIYSDSAAMQEKLAGPVDFEALQLLYKPIAKKTDDTNTVQDAVDWFLTVQESIVDINHLLKIDNILVNLFE